LNVRFLMVIAIMLLTGCQSQIISLKPPLEVDGELYLYARPFTREGERLSFTLDTVAAVRDDGVEFPLTLSLHDMTTAAMNRQRSLANGQLPPGNYRGLSVRVSHPRLRTEEGTAALQVPEGGVNLDFPFTVQKQRALLLSLTFDYNKSVREGFSFSPVFNITIPARPVTGLVGYVTNSGANTITVFDKQYKEVIGIIATGGEPRGVVFDQQRKRAYVALAREDAVQVLDIFTGEEVRRIRLHNGDTPEELALTPDGTSLLTVNPGSNTVSLIDPLSYFEVTRINVGNGPFSLVLDPSGQKAYVFNSFASTMSVIDVSRRMVIAEVASEPGLSRGGFNKAGDRFYTIHDLSSYLTALNPFTLAIQQRSYVGMGMSALKVDSLTNLVYTAKKHDAQVEVMEPFSFNPIATIRTGGSNNYMTIDADENKLYVVNPARSKLLVVNLVNYKVEAEIEVGADPFRVALIGER
jgi:YVTN family beta-propeller protein